MTVPTAEWLEADGLGGFASGTSDGVRTRRYHGLLLAATTPPTGRVMLVNGLEAWVETANGRYPISSQRYAPDVVHPDGVGRLTAFVNDPWPRWTYQLEDGTVVEHELAVRHGAPATALAWRLQEPRPDVRLFVRPLLSGRDYHSTASREHLVPLRGAGLGERVTWTPYDGLPAIVAITNGRYSRSTRVVSQLPVRRGADARPRLRRGPRLAGSLRVRPEPRRGGDGADRGRGRITRHG